MRRGSCSFDCVLGSQTLVLCVAYFFFVYVISSVSMRVQIMHVFRILTPCSNKWLEYNLLHWLRFIIEYKSFYNII